MAGLRLVAKPDAQRVQLYTQMQNIHDQIVRDLSSAFSTHLKLIAG
jgi:hypothetical protein